MLVLLGAVALSLVPKPGVARMATAEVARPRPEVFVRPAAAVAPAFTPWDQNHLYVLKYFMGESWGVKIEHTSLAICPATAARQAYLDAYASAGRWDGAALYQAAPLPQATGRLVKQVAHTVPVFVPGLVDGSCVEVGFYAENRQQRRPTPAGMLIEQRSSWCYAGDCGPLVHPVGLRAGADVARALARTQQCGVADDGVVVERLDFHPFTYDFLEHNCHHHTDAMLKGMQLPAWSKQKGLPAFMMPEDTSKNWFLGNIIKWVVTSEERWSDHCRDWKAQQDALRAAEEAKRAGRGCDWSRGCPF